MFQLLLPQWGDSSSSFLNIGSIGNPTIGKILVILALIITIISILVSLVLHFHWFKYGWRDGTILFMQVLYTTVLGLSLLVVIQTALTLT